MASGSEDKKIYRKWRRHFNRANAIYSIAFHKDGKILASGSEDNAIKLWNIHDRNEIMTLTPNAGPIYSVAFTNDGQILASGSISQTGKIILWNVESWT